MRRIDWNGFWSCGRMRWQLKGRFSRNFNQKSHFWHVKMVTKNFQCDSLKEGSKIPRKTFFLWWKPNFEKTMILYMTIPNDVLWNFQTFFRRNMIWTILNGMTKKKIPERMNYDLENNTVDMTVLRMCNTDQNSLSFPLSTF